MLDVRRLRTLREVALHGTVRAASEALSFTPSAVSQQLSALEREVGYELLERRGRSVHLTPAGLLLVERAEAILAQLAEAEADAKALAGASEPAVRIASFASAAATIVADAVSENGLAAHILETDPRIGLARLREGEVDVRLVARAPRARDDAVSPEAVPAGPEGRPRRLLDSSRNEALRCPAHLGGEGSFRNELL